MDRKFRNVPRRQRPDPPALAIRHHLVGHPSLFGLTRGLAGLLLEATPTVSGVGGRKSCVADSTATVSMPEAHSPPRAGTRSAKFTTTTIPLQSASRVLKKG